MPSGGWRAGGRRRRRYVAPPHRLSGEHPSQVDVQRNVPRLLSSTLRRDIWHGSCSPDWTSPFAQAADSSSVAVWNQDGGRPAGRSSSCVRTEINLGPVFGNHQARDGPHIAPFLCQPPAGDGVRHPDDSRTARHHDVGTTMIYTHVLNRGPRGVQSPLDR
jgi:hypothetical protein